MINREDLRDFNIGYERMCNIYEKAYPNLKEDYNTVKVFLSLLLNNYIKTEMDLQDLLHDVDFYLKIVENYMEGEDYTIYLTDILAFLIDEIPGFENQEKYEICHNLKSFVRMICLHYGENKNNYLME